MTEYLTEQEQIELLKNWIKQYSLVILAGVLISIAVISGWRYWQERQITIINTASALYDDLLSKRAQNDTEGTLQQAQNLFKNYPRTVYGEMAAFMLAREAALKNNYDEAQHDLQWIIDHSRTKPLRQMARIRLARLLIAAQKPKAALTILQTTDDTNFDGLTDEVKGDAYLALNQPEEARNAYQQALKALPDAEIIRPLLQMKFDNLTTVS